MLKFWEKVSFEKQVKRIAKIERFLPILMHTPNGVRTIGKPDFRRIKWEENVLIRIRGATNISVF